MIYMTFILLIKFSKHICFDNSVEAPTAQKIIDAIRLEVNQFTENAAADDDRTVLIIKRD